MWPSWWLDGVRLAGVPVPAPTRRLAFREMTPDDLDDMAALLGDPQAMRYYPHPKTRQEALAWIAWNQRLYREHGFGLWLLTLRATGAFVGDCGLTPPAGRRRDRAGGRLPRPGGAPGPRPGHRSRGRLPRL